MDSGNNDAVPYESYIAARLEQGRLISSELLMRWAEMRVEAQPKLPDASVASAELELLIAPREDI